MGVKYGFVQKAGSWYSYGNEKIGQGKDNVKNFLSENPKIAQEIEDNIRAEVFGDKESEDIKDTDTRQLDPKYSCCV